MRTISVTTRDLVTGDETDTTLELSEQDYYLIGHTHYATADYEVVAVNGVRLDPETGRYYED